MSKFKVGDKVRINKPADIRKSTISWTANMESFDGSVGTIIRVFHNKGFVEMEGTSYAFDTDWLTKIEPVVSLTTDDIIGMAKDHPEHAVAIRELFPEVFTMHTWNYSVSTPIIWTSFDHGYVKARTYEEAKEMAIEQLSKHFNLANKSLAQLDISIHFDETAVEVTLKRN